MNPNPGKPLRNLSQWLSYLERIHSRPIDLGLERVKSVAEAADLLPAGGIVFLVAGTNGKGSAVAALEAICREAGYTTATYTSPHLNDYRERVLVNNGMLSEEEHCEAFTAIEEARGETSLTYFEFGTLAALYLIKKNQPDVTILEIGLGGRLDAVNIIEPDVAIVTSVGVDHIDFLGSDREGIGFEKAGIYRAHKPAICGDKEPPTSLEQHADSIAAELTFIERDFVIRDNQFLQFSPDCDEPGLIWELPSVDLPEASVACALQAVSLCADLHVEQHAISAALARINLPGRFQKIASAPSLYLDVGHNPHAAKWLAAKLLAIQENSKQSGKVIAVCGMLNDKDIQGTLAELLGVVGHWIFAPTEGPRGTSAQTLQSVYQAFSEASIDSQCADSVVNGVEKAIEQADNNDTIIVFGSFITVSEVIKAQREGRF